MAEFVCKQCGTKVVNRYEGSSETFYDQNNGQHYLSDVEAQDAGFCSKACQAASSGWTKYPK
ncbi:MAG: hypothetical protein LBO69_00965 [Ignavibacteria bacterium]|jgi:hypothetical protein|nr:hypothetical protein [Ignavibacteria bacterium]